MVYFDDTGRRIRLRVRRKPSSGGVFDQATIRYVRQVAERNPRFTPDEVHAEICHSQGRHDITRQAVRAILADT